ncbi:Acetyltransferase, fragment [Alteracholeplasma palmae J233]|uniref:Acetyltransferase n=1 Tax=Alteracholeplasma palmae (strain ATCC 49389 / J233) TaxID=1318466 RepID=U4KK60_ALTPJ|nr:GNAT family N-acetyltransferase [Alteracholeplasma palmae]CCV63903.1 Acetyltransferase, fragment [Alteracholeplasma palmae J233]
MDEKSFFIDDLCVDEEKRGLSIGKKLLDDLEIYIGKRKVSLNVWFKNEAAIKFYEKIGFKVLKYVLEK